MRNEFNVALDAVLASIREKAIEQFNYNLESNVPAKILKLEDCASHAIQNGLVSAISAMNHFDTDRAIAFAIDVLEDSNCHSEAKVLSKHLSH